MQNIHKMLALSLLLNVLIPLEGQAVPPFDKQAPVVNVGRVDYFTQGSVYVVSNRPISIDSMGFDPKRGLSNNRLPRMSFYIATSLKDTVFMHSQSTLSTLLQAIPTDKPILLYVNGHGKTLQHNIERGISISKRFEVSVIVFDWPTDNLSLRKSRWHAKKVAENLATIIASTSAIKQGDESGHQPISILFHSIGNEVLKQMVNNKHANKFEHVNIENIVINAAAVNSRNHTAWMNEIDFAEHILVTFNSGDKPLRGARFFFGGQQLGALNKGPLSLNATYINFTPIAGQAHSYFMGENRFETEHANVYRFYHLAFRGKDIPVSDTNMFKKREDGLGINLY